MHGLSELLHLEVAVRNIFLAVERGESVPPEEARCKRYLKIPLAVYIGVEEGEEGEGTSSCPWLRSQSDMTMALAFMINIVSVE